MKPFLIGLVGLSGAGKSTVADHLEAQGGIKRFRMDAYYKNTEDCPKLADGTVHWDLPESLHMDEVYEALREIKEGNEIFLPVYNRRLCKRVGSVLYEPRPVVFAEGMQLFADERIRKLFDLRFWMEVPEEVALERRLKRQPDYDLDYYKNVALPSQRKTVLPLKGHAHEIIDGDRSLREIAMETDAYIRKHLGV
jgi:uridine kinase